MPVLVRADEIAEWLEACAGSSPPCQLITVEGDRECGMPSVARVHIKCGGCGITEHLFVCGPCHDLVTRHKTECTECGSPIAGWWAA